MSKPRRLIAALLCGTALSVPAPAKAAPAVLFVQGIAASLGAYGAAGATVGLALGGAAAAGVAVGTFLTTTLVGKALLGLGASAIISALTPRPEIPKPSRSYQNFAQAISPMDRVYGELRKGGIFGLRSGRKKNYFYWSVTLAAHSCAGVVDHYLDLDKVLVNDAGEVITEPYWQPVKLQSYVDLHVYTGKAGQAADPTLVAAMPAVTDAHDFAGHTYIAVRAQKASLEKGLSVYSQGQRPAIVPLLRGWDEIYDPRTGEAGYSNNWALCFAHELSVVWGLPVDWARVAIEADVCDELVTNRAGGLQARWTFNHTFGYDQDFEAVRAQFMGAADAFIWQRADGVVDFYVGRWHEPTLTIGEHDVFALTESDGNIGLNPPTEFFAEYREPSNGHRETPTGAFVVEDSDRRIARPLALYGVNSHNQAIRAIKPLARAERARRKFQAVFGLVGFEIMAGRSADGIDGLFHRFLRISHPLLGDDVLVEVGRLEMNPDGFTFSAELSESSAETRAFDAAAEEPTPPEYNSDAISGNDDIDTIDDLAGVAVSGAGGVAQIQWTWTAPHESLNPVLRHRQAGQDWVEIVLPTETSEFTATGLIDGATYEAQIAARSSGFQYSAWMPVDPVPVVALANSTPPAQHPTGSFSTSQIGGDVTLTFTAPNDGNYYATRIYRADYSAGYSGPYDIDDAALVHLEYGAANAVDSWTDTAVPSGHSAWWIVPINASGVAGPATGPETQDIA